MTHLVHDPDPVLLCLCTHTLLPSTPSLSSPIPGSPTRALLSETPTPLFSFIIHSSDTSLPRTRRMKKSTRVSVTNHPCSIRSGAGSAEPMSVLLDHPEGISPSFQVCSSYLLQRGMDSSKILAHLRASTCKARQCSPKFTRTPSRCHMHPQGPACLLLHGRLRGNIGQKQ